jgi:hypothetical protein
MVAVETVSKTAERRSTRVRTRTETSFKPEAVTTVAGKKRSRQQVKAGDTSGAVDTGLGAGKAKRSRLGRDASTNRGLST